MTIAISVKVDDGIVLAADSATTWANSSGVANIWNNAKKIMRLHKKVPAGGVTWGVGNIGRCSMKILAKDFRQTITDPNSATYVDPGNYSIEEIARKFKTFMIDGHYQASFGATPKQPDVGFLIAGYSFGQSMNEVWQMGVKAGNSYGPTLIRDHSAPGLNWYGMPKSVQRLVLGFDPELESIMLSLGAPQQIVQQIMQELQNRLQIPLAVQFMPIQDAIDLAVFLAETAAAFTRFAPGANMVGGLIEVAAITKYEGFRWVRRKHYYDPALNP